MINEELITDCLKYISYGENDIRVCTGRIQENITLVHFEVNKSYMTSMTVLELANICKLIAVSKGCYITSNPKFTVLSHTYEFNADIKHFLHCNTEQEAIFKAFQYMLKNIRGEENDNNF